MKELSLVLVIIFLLKLSPVPQVELYYCGSHYNFNLLGRNPLQIKAEVAEKGDLGLVAEGSRTTQRTMFTPPPLTVIGVFNKLTDIAKLTGHSVSI